LPSCGIPSLRFAKPAPDLPQEFNLPQTGPNSDVPEVFSEAAGSENSAQLKVEDFFADRKLTGLIFQALNGNQELRILAEEVQAASAAILGRQGAYLPFVTIGGNAGLGKISNFTLEGAGLQDDPFRPGQYLPNPLPNFLLGTSLFWQMDVWRQLRNARDAAALRYYAAGEGRSFVATRTIAEIADSYYELV